jgi:glycosyltransferase involved in cell wall biosynthesis
MSERRILLSVVCPAYEEEEALPHFHAELMRVLDGLEADYVIEVIYVDDGSLDGTLEVLRSMTGADQRVRYLSLSRNFGHQAALSAGLEHARGDIVITMDADLQHPPQVIPKLIAEWEAGADLVITIRADDPTLKWSKRFASRAFYKVLRWMSGTEMRPSAADFRLMTRKTVAALLSLKETHRFVRGLVQWLGFNCKEVRFEPRHRIAGRSKYTLGKQLTLGLDGILSFSKLPLRLVLGFGLGMVGLGLCGALATVVGLASGSMSNPSLWVLLSAMTLIGGAVLFGLGIVGEYVARIYEQVKQRPAYLLKETGNVAAIAEAADKVERTKMAGRNGRMVA